MKRKLPLPSVQSTFAATFGSKMMLGVSLARKRLIISAVPTNDVHFNIQQISNANAPNNVAVPAMTGYRARIIGACCNTNGGTPNMQLTATNGGTIYLLQNLSVSNTNTFEYPLGGQGILGSDGQGWNISIPGLGAALTSNLMVQAVYEPTTTPRVSLSNLTAVIDNGCTIPANCEPHVIDIETWGEFVQRNIFCISNVPVQISLTEIYDWEPFTEDFPDAEDYSALADTSGFGSDSHRDTGLAVPESPNGRAVSLRA